MLSRMETPTPPTIERASAVPGRVWAWAIVLGLAGQLAWAVENMYLNVFVYNTITDDPQVLAVLVASSAASATLMTLLAGAWSDRVGRRREFIALGYILWGASTAAFGWVGAGTAAIAVIAIVLLDCLMSALGATANDAAFNAWITDSTTPANRGRVEGVLATFPLLAMLLIFGALDPLTQQGNWRLFFGIIGAATALVGIVAWARLRDGEIHEVEGAYLGSVLKGLRPSTMRAQPALYLALATWAVFATSTQIFLPYLIIYVQRFLRIAAYPHVLGSVLLGAAIISALGGRLLDRFGATRAIPVVLAIYVLGLSAMFAARDALPVTLAGIVMMSGFMLCTAAISASVRNHTLAERAGSVQGVRMIAATLIPMVIGPFVGAAVISGADETYVDLGVVKQVPTPWIFLAAAALGVLVLVPTALLRRAERRSR